MAFAELVAPVVRADGVPPAPLPQAPEPVTADPSASVLIDRDLSHLRFQARVLEEARDSRNPLLARVKFLAIVGSNVDEFVMGRAAALRRKPAAARTAIERYVRRLLTRTFAHWERRLRPLLVRNGIDVVDYGALSVTERDEVRRRFEDVLLPLVERRTLESTGAFPALPSLGLGLFVAGRCASGEREVVLRLTNAVPPLLPFERRTAAGVAMRAYVPVIQVLREAVPALLPDMRIGTVRAFRVLRAAELPACTSTDGDLRARARSASRLRDANPVVALMIEPATPPTVLDRLIRDLHVPPDAVFEASHLVDPRVYWQIGRLDRPDLQERPVAPHSPPELDGEIFCALRRSDVLLHHPYDSFQPVLNLLERAARDPSVVSIAITLYRTERDSRIVRALLDAAQHGKDVRVLIELGARLDETRNALWADALERAGASVFHAPAGLKVHAKFAIVTRREPAGLRRYAHISSGNYNATTARGYTDVALLTSDEALAADVASLFDLATGTAKPVRFRKLLVAPTTLRHALGALIDREIACQLRGGYGHVVLKMNALTDRDLIERLCRASAAGVRVDLIVRGICCLRPGIAGMTDRIHVRSIVGRYLQHSRAWYFHNGGQCEVYIGSADLMPRNLDRRIEMMAPITAPALRDRVRRELLNAYLADTTQARVLSPNGTYLRLGPRIPEPRPTNGQGVSFAGREPIR